MFLRYQFSWFKPIPLRLPETRAPVKQSLSVWYMARYLTEVIKAKCYTLCSLDHLARLSAGEWCVTDSEKEFAEQVGKKALKYPFCLEKQTFSYNNINNHPDLNRKKNDYTYWHRVKYCQYLKSFIKFEIKNFSDVKLRFPKSNCYR